MTEIRWEQRFENFEKAFLLFQRIQSIQEPSEAEEMGNIQAFEIAFELAWKTLKDYLQKEGYQPNTPRETIKQAFQIGLIENGELWLEALQNRNETVHIYDETNAKKITKIIHEKYFGLIEKLYQVLKAKYA